MTLPRTATTSPPVKAFTKTELIQMTRISKSRIEEYVRDGKLVAHYSGRKPIFYPTDVDSFLASLPTEPH